MYSRIDIVDDVGSLLDTSVIETVCMRFIVFISILIIGYVMNNITSKTPEKEVSNY